MCIGTLLQLPVPLALYWLLQVLQLHPSALFTRHPVLETLHCGTGGDTQGEFLYWPGRSLRAASLEDSVGTTSRAAPCRTAPCWLQAHLAPGARVCKVFFVALVEQDSRQLLGAGSRTVYGTSGEAVYHIALVPSDGELPLQAA